MIVQVLLGLLIPFAGTTAGSACVVFMKNELKDKVQRALTGFASGVMVAASIWSLLIPAMTQSEETMGRLAFMPAVVGFGLVFYSCYYLTVLSLICICMQKRLRALKAS